MLKDCQSDKDDAVDLKKGQLGKVTMIDADGDAVIKFEGIEEMQPITEEHFVNFEKVSAGAAIGDSAVELEQPANVEGPVIELETPPTVEGSAVDPGGYVFPYLCSKNNLQQLLIQGVVDVQEQVVRYVVDPSSLSRCGSRKFA